MAGPRLHHIELTVLDCQSVSLKFRAKALRLLANPIEEPKYYLSTEVNTRSPGQALILLSEGGPRSVPRVLSEILARSLGVQDFLC